MEEQFERESGLGDGTVPADSSMSDDLSAVPAFLHAGDADARPEPTTSASNLAPIRRPPTSPSARASSPETADPGAIPLATISPRRLLHVVAVVALAWGMISFGRQVATASAASSHADELRGANAALQGQVGAMQAELALIQEQRYVDLQARAFRLGNPNEIPFALEANPPSLAPDAPGSASTRLGAVAPPSNPLDHWLDILFGAGG